MKINNTFILLLTELFFFSFLSSKSLAQEPLLQKEIPVKNWHFQTGVGLEQGNKRSAINISGTIAYKRWSLNTGVSIANVSNGRFKDETVFNQQTGQNFRNIYFNGEKDTLPSNNINYLNTLFQIPVVIAYNMPLKNDYTFIIGIGTDIDFYANQQTTFEQPVKNSTTLYKEEDAELEVVPFNNVTISSGFEKKWNAFSLQLAPFISPQIKHVLYKKEDVYAGFKLRAFYNF